MLNGRRLFEPQSRIGTLPESFCRFHQLFKSPFAAEAG